MGKNIITGYAAVWGQPYDMGGYMEIIDRKALDGVDFSNCRLLLNHDPNYLLARTKSGTLTVKADHIGLFYRAELPDTATGNDVAELLRRGDIRESSWGFTIGQAGKQWSADGRTLTITKVSKLYDVSPVTFPANPETTATLEAPIFKKKAENQEQSDDAEFLQRQRAHLEGLRETQAEQNRIALQAFRNAPRVDFNSPEELAKHRRRENQMREILHS